MYTAYKNRDNTFAIQLVRDDTALTQTDIEAITKVELLFNGTYYDSDTYPNAFDLTSRKSEGVIVFKLGEIPVIEAARDRKTELIIYNSEFPDGVVWELLDIKVIDLDA